MVEVETAILGKQSHQSIEEVCLCREILCKIKFHTSEEKMHYQHPVWRQLGGHMEKNKIKLDL